MFWLVTAITVIVALIYLAFILIRNQQRTKYIEALGYKRASFQGEEGQLSASDLSDFLQLPLKIRKGFRKDKGGVVFIVSDVTAIIARGAYSGPSQATYFIVGMSHFQVPDFTLRAKRFLETSFELRDSVTLDDAGRIVMWGDDSAVEFLTKRNPELVKMLQEQTDLVIRGVKGQLIVWLTSGYVPNSQIKSYLHFLERHFLNLN